MINEKTSAKELKDHVKNNNLQKLFNSTVGKPYNKGTKEELLAFIKQQEIADNIEQVLSSSEKTEEKKEEKKEETISGSTHINDLTNLSNIAESNNDDIIEQIPVFAFKDKEKKNEEKKDKFDTNNIKLNAAQNKVKRYLNRFPEKLKVVSDKPTFKQEFAQLKDADPNLNEEENNKNQALLLEVERTLSAANAAGLIKDQVLITIGWIEDLIVSVRENKTGKIPQYIVDIVGNVRIEGLARVLEQNQNFHDCVDELMIKYDNCEALLQYLSVEKRLLLIILGSACIVHKINTEEHDKLKNTPIPKDANIRFKNL